MTSTLPDQTKRLYRISLATALSLVIAYGLRLELPFIVPLFTFLLALKSEQPVGLKGLLGLVLIITLTLGSGMLLIPLLTFYPFTGLLLVILGIYLSAHLLVNMGKALVGVFFMAGMTMISCVGTQSSVIAGTMVDSILMGIIIAILSQWLVFPFFALPVRAQPEPGKHPDTTENAPQEQERSHNAALQTTAIVFPVYLLALTNPSLYLPLIMKSVTLGQQTSDTDLQKAGNELLTCTLAGGAMAIVGWLLLQINPNLWIFFLTTLLICLWVVRRLLGLTASHFSPSFWQNALVTFFILIGPAVQDTLNGKDPLRAFAVRLSLFIALSIYAWFAARLIQRFRQRKQHRHSIVSSLGELNRGAS